jgi:hypothetical protein
MHFVKVKIKRKRVQLVHGSLERTLTICNESIDVTIEKSSQPIKDDDYPDDADDFDEEIGA